MKYLTKSNKNNTTINKAMNEKMIRDAYCRIRTIDNTIPDDVLDFMLEASLQKLSKMQEAERGIVLIGEPSGMGESLVRILSAQNHNFEVAAIDLTKMMDMNKPTKTYTIDEICRPEPIMITNRHNNGDTRVGDYEFLSGKQLRNLRREKKPKK